MTLGVGTGRLLVAEAEVLGYGPVLSRVSPARGSAGHMVVDRNGFREFACHCGHSFLKPEGDQQLHITHPAICVCSGHRIRFVARRAGYAEFVCRDCGHPFCFNDAGQSSRLS